MVDDGANVPNFAQLPEDDAHLRERTLSSKKVYEGYFLQLLQDQVELPDGKVAGREYLVHPGAVAIIPMLHYGRILLERQFRYPLGQSFIEIPAGKLDPAEDSLACAQRELVEETGFIAQQWHLLGKIHPIISHSTEFIDIYLAQGLTLTAANLDEGEHLDVFGASLKEIQQWIKEGKITDVKTLIGVYWLQEYLEKLDH